MQPFLLQDWVTIQSTTQTVTQGEGEWLDMSSFLDLVAWLEVKQVSTSAGTMSLGIQTCPSKDDSLFQNMNDTTVAIAAGVQVMTLLRDTAKCPLTKWLRWQLIASTTPSTWQVTFRIWVTASQPGGYALEDLMQDNAMYAGGPDYVQLGGGDGSSAAPTTSPGISNAGLLTSLKGPKVLTGPSKTLPSNVSPGFQTPNKKHSPTTPSFVLGPHYHHGWMGIPQSYNPLQRYFVKPVIGAFQDNAPWDSGPKEK